MFPEGPIVVGSMLDLICEAAFEFPWVSFIFTGPDGQNMLPTQSGNHTATISINFLSREEFGSYTCMAINQYSSSQKVLETKYLGRICLSLATL